VSELFFKDMLTHEDETTMFSQNVGHQSPSKVVPHSRRMHSSYSTAGGGWKFGHAALAEILKYLVKNAVPVPICQHQIPH
jgi:hypothetical protein